MHIVFLSGRADGGNPRHLNLARPAGLALMAVLVLGAVGTPFAIGLQVGRSASGPDPGRLHRMLAEQRDEITRLKAQVQEHADALAARMRTLNAHLTRAGALGRRLTSLANVDRREFNFDDEPVLAAGSASAGGQAVDIGMALSDLESRVNLRDVQLAALENALNGGKIEEATRPTGAPVAIAVISSPFGWRTDPVNGEEGRFHEGVDFAGVPGEPIQAVAAGIVTRAGWDGGYGNLVEINHGNGFVTRYAHCERILVTAGQSVVRGQGIGLMGSTGHSTGPHVHFEVRRSGYPVDPMPFVKLDRLRR